MDSYNFNDVKVEKPNAIWKFIRTRKITTLFRFVEIMVVIFLVIVTRFFTQLALSLKMTSEFIRGTFFPTLVSTKFVFILGNAIIIALFLISGKYPGKKDGESSSDFYEEYLEKCKINEQPFTIEESKALDACTCSVVYEDKKVITRSQSEKLEPPAPVKAEVRRRYFRRSRSENSLMRSAVSGKKKKATAVGRGAAPSYAEDDMSSEEFRRTVEAFIARQQRFLREEEEFSAAVSI